MKPLCLSGGAKGADTLWGECALTANMDVCHFSFEGHNINVPKHTVIILTDELLNEANSLLKESSSILKKNFPKDKFVLKLLQRNYYQVRDTASVYAVGKMIDDQVQGGTSWAITMAKILRVPRIYFFEQTRNVWLDIYTLEETVPSYPDGIWTGIGTRELNYNGILAIKNIF
jgi:hypothetical protein